MNNDNAISVSHLTKRYRIRQPGELETTLTERALRWRPRKRRFEHFNAIDDVSFDIPWGSAVGIIGRNGAGKSTLLKVLTRITAPTAGRVEVGGRIGSLLEVGTGFHPELTGRENVFLNGTLLGMRRREIQRRFDDIVQFAGVEPFLDTQVKRFSTGMYIRLAFAVAAHLESEILVVDEVLAVGDAEFQARCLAKMREVSQSGRTVLLVSHQIQTITSLATSALFLQRGRLLYSGAVEGALAAYRKSFERTANNASDHELRNGNGELRFTGARSLKDSYAVAEEKMIEFSIGANPDAHGQALASADFIDENLNNVAQCDSRLVGFWVDPKEETKGVFCLKTPWLKPGNYQVNLWIFRNGTVMDEWTAACSFTVLPIFPNAQTVPIDAISYGPVVSNFTIDPR